MSETIENILDETKKIARVANVCQQIKNVQKLRAQSTELATRLKTYIATPAAATDLDTKFATVKEAIDAL